MATKLAAHVLERLGERIAAHAGLSPPDWVLEARLLDRISALGLDAPQSYIDLISSPSGTRELQHLLETLRVGETRFFRHRSHVRALTDVVVPALLEKCRERAHNQKRPVRVWSAGCATGQEPYTLAMVLRSSLPAKSVDIEILATDISDDALETARAAVYPSNALSHVPARWRKSAFLPAGSERWRVADSLRELVAFDRLNLAEGPFPRRCDVIWCRNVLIYFTPEAREKTVGRLLDSLAPDGFLFVGYAETLRQFAELDMIRTPDAVLYRKAKPQIAVPPPIKRVESSTIPLDAPPVIAEEAMIELRGRYDDSARLSSELSEVMAGPYRRVIIDLDGAELLDDAAAAVLRRARSAARAAGVQFELVAARPGPRRWLRRSGLDEPEPQS